MAKWKQLRRGKSARHATFCAQTVAKVVKVDSENDTTSDVTEGEAVPLRTNRTLHLNSIDPYGYLNVRRLPGSRPTLGSFLSRNAEKGDILALYSRDTMSIDQVHDGRDRRFITKGSYLDEHHKTTEIYADGAKGEYSGSYVRDHPNHHAKPTQLLTCGGETVDRNWSSWHERESLLGKKLLGTWGSNRTCLKCVKEKN
jgi:hypothetical protein